MSKTLKRAFGTLAGLCLAAGVAMTSQAAAQTQTRTAAHKDWSVFESGTGGQKVCWIVTRPTESSARNSNGRAVSVNRGEIFLMVAVRPGENVKNEVSFISGYPLREGSEVKVEIGSRNWDMFVKGENAWLSSPELDDQLVRAMRRGLEATVTGQSQRGNTTVDKFSLSGFTASIDQARQLCN